MRKNIKRTIELVDLAENSYGSIYKAPFYCKEFQMIRKMFPEKEPRGNTYYTHKNIKSIRKDYERGISLWKIQSRNTVRNDSIRRYASMYNWKRPSKK